MKKFFKNLNWGPVVFGFVISLAVIAGGAAIYACYSALTTKIEGSYPSKRKIDVQEGSAYRPVTTFAFKNHSYIRFGSGKYNSVVHDPDCPCHK